LPEFRTAGISTPIARPSSVQGSADDHSATESKSHANPKTRRTVSNLNIRRSCNCSSRICHPAEQCCTAKCHNSQAVPGGIAVRAYDLTIAEAPNVRKKTLLAPRFLGPLDLGSGGPWDLGTVRAQIKRNLERRLLAQVFFDRHLSHFMHRFPRPFCDNPVSNDRTVVRSALIVEDKTRSSRG
jgi:hypothetical protein